MANFAEIFMDRFKKIYYRKKRCDRIFLKLLPQKESLVLISASITTAKLTLIRSFVPLFFFIHTYIYILYNIFMLEVFYLELQKYVNHV